MSFGNYFAVPLHGDRPGAPPPDPRDIFEPEKVGAAPLVAVSGATLARRRIREIGNRQPTPPKERPDGDSRGPDLR